LPLGELLARRRLLVVDLEAGPREALDDAANEGGIDRVCREPLRELVGAIVRRLVPAGPDLLGVFERLGRRERRRLEAGRGGGGGGGGGPRDGDGGDGRERRAGRRGRAAPRGERNRDRRKRVQLPRPSHPPRVTAPRHRSSSAQGATPIRARSIA